MDGREALGPPGLYGGVPPVPVQACPPDYWCITCGTYHARGVDCRGQSTYEED